MHRNKQSRFRFQATPFLRLHANTIGYTPKAQTLEKPPYPFVAIVPMQAESLFLPLHGGLPPAPSAAPPPHGGRGTKIPRARLFPRLFGSCAFQAALFSQRSRKASIGIACMSGIALANFSGAQSHQASASMRAA